MLSPPTSELSLQRLEIALLCIHVLQKHEIEIDGLGPRDLFRWAGVPESELSTDVMPPRWRRENAEHPIPPHPTMLR